MNDTSQGILYEMYSNIGGFLIFRWPAFFPPAAIPSNSNIFTLLKLCTRALQASGQILLVFVLPLERRTI
jgi:hypothetical protein